MPADNDNSIITLDDGSGTASVCKMLELIEFGDSEYALLLNLGEENGPRISEKDAALVIMRVTERDGQSVFQVIDDDDEYESVVAYVKELAGG